LHKGPDNNPHDGWWEYWERYELAGEEGSRYIYAPVRWYENGKWGKNVRRPYQPLVGRDGLFFKFARLGDDGELSPGVRFDDLNSLDTDKNAQAAYDWVDEWGVLGLTPREEEGRFYYTTLGGEGDTVVRFAEEAWAANAVLRLYEAATAEGGPDIEAIQEIMEYGGVGPRSRRYIIQTPERARNWALFTTVEQTQGRVARYCHPALYRRPGHNHFIQGSGFSNLLGALWLEMFWVLLSDETRRCENPECNRIVPFEPTPAREWSNLEQNVRTTGYATRVDKVYCGKKCANRHYYLTKTKPRRAVAKKD
jgi:hypothetical protein